MRLRFFFTILTVLTLASITVIVLHAAILRRARLSLIDQQVRATATALFNSELSDFRTFSFAHVDDLISEELGESRIGKFFIVRNSRGDIIFESSSAKVLPRKDIPLDNTWITIETGENYIRVLNLKLPRFQDRTIQVGVVWNSESVNPQYLSVSTLLLFLAVLGVGSLASLFLTSFLLRPVARLSEFISGSSEKLQNQQLLSPVPEGIGGPKWIDRSLLSSRDEYQKLVRGYNSLIERVNKHSKNSRLWAYQMAHELKTPLTLINLEAEALQSNSLQTVQETLPKIDSIQNELKKISETISSFLSWAELENSTGSKHLFANKLVTLTKGIIQRLDPDRKRIELLAEGELTILCNPLHLEQLILNLLTNSMKYSNPNPIQVKIYGQQISVIDQGKGISQVILDRLGEPFNKGSEHEGSGLGLAWVNSICKFYKWDLQIKSSDTGTAVTVNFSQTM